MGEGIGQHGDEGGALGAAQDGVHHRAVVGPEHTAVIPHPHAGGPRRDPVNQAGSKLPETAVLAAHPDRADHVIAFPGLLHQAGDLLGGVLEVGVQGDDQVPPRFRQPRPDGGMLAVVPVEEDTHNLPGMLPGRLPDEGGGFIPAAVIHQDQLGRSGNLL